ncbi:MAG TPA: glycolate oxidase subunit GlcF [Burkholderiales bacterium]|nr:glycolate oxidase subunit GlcF [Burkholderiales bacterium]
MQTNLADFIKDTPEGREANAILRKCVHCGFCTATCPTYQLLGDELDGPRGRIYLIKQVLEGAEPTAKTQLHLDRCLTCRACETTCPSGVHYSRLLDIGRHLVEERVGRGAAQSAWHGALRTVIPRSGLFTPLLRLGQLLRPVLPPAFKRKLPPRAAPRGVWPTSGRARKMLVLEGCVQPGLSPNTNAAAARVLDHLGISLVRARQAGCCGALAFHLDAQEEARSYMRSNIDAWWPQIEQGAEAIVITASGCGVMVKDYGYQLAHDPAYAEKAKRVSDLARDIGEILFAEKERLKSLVTRHEPRVTSHPRVAFHAPCTLQHGLKLRGKVEELLSGLGFELTGVPDSHLCCGSAGTYSILQPELSAKLRENKIAALESGAPNAILTGNIGCQAHLQAATDLPVRHWIEAVEEVLSLSPSR